MKEQPWLPNGPIPADVSWRLEGYERVRHQVARRDAQQAENDRSSAPSRVTA